MIVHRLAELFCVSFSTTVDDKRTFPEALPIELLRLCLCVFECVVDRLVHCGEVVAEHALRNAGFDALLFAKLILGITRCDRLYTVIPKYDCCGFAEDDAVDLGKAT